MKNATPSQESGALFDKQDTSAHTQRLQILAHLRVESHNTLELRDKGHMAPAPRIMELRAKGYVIHTRFEDAKDKYGIVHRRVARYFLISEPSTRKSEVAA